MQNYVEIAEEHWRKFRPSEYGAMRPAERLRFFQDLAEQVETRVAETWPDLAGADRPDETTDEKLKRTQTARTMAESQAVREILLPEPETTEETPDSPGNPLE